MRTRAELASLAANIPGYTGGTIDDLLSDWADAREQASPQAQDAGDLLARFADEVNGLLK